MTTRSEPLTFYLAKDRISGFNDDKWKQLPFLIMIGNGTSWALMISLDLEVISEYRYRFKKMRIQTELLDLLRDIPVCVGHGFKGDVHEIEQFYTEVSGKNLEMSGFIDLSALALIQTQKGIVDPTPVAENLLDMSLDEILSDVEWEPTVEEILTLELSLVVGDAVEEPERLEPVEPVLDMEPEKEKLPDLSV